MTHFLSSDAPAAISALVEAIQEKKAYLSELDGAIGDGDHGVNMSKGFGLAAEQLAGTSYTLDVGLETLGMTLMMEIGGAMGPLYGTLFMEMATTCRGHDEIDPPLFGRMLAAGRDGVMTLGSANRGDKTLVDVLIPAVGAYQDAVSRGETFGAALIAMSQASQEGLESTREMVAKIGRSSRLGERSRGHLDAGAASCALILTTMAETISQNLRP